MSIRIVLVVTSAFVLNSVLTPITVFAQEKKTARIRIGKDTTFLTKPVGEDGYINYVAALDQRLREGVTPENNANVPIRLMLGERELSEPLKAKYYALLGIDAPENPQPRIVSQSEMLAEFGRQIRC